MTADGVLITGTTSGIGRGLLEHYCRNGTRVVSVNRRRLAAFEAAHPGVRFECVDVRARGQVADLVNELARSGQLPSVFFLNAGINRIDNDEAFDLAVFDDVLQTNLYGVLSFIQPLLQLPADQRPRHVIAISSFAGYVGNPYGLGYHVSKRALSACFDVWSRMYAGTEMTFQQVVLGPVRTPIFTMAQRLPGWMVRVKDLFSASLDGTVRALVGMAETRRSKMFYPRRAIPLYLATWLTQSFIPGLLPGFLPGFFQGRKTLDGLPRRGGR